MSNFEPVKSKEEALRALHRSVSITQVLPEIHLDGKNDGLCTGQIGMMLELAYQLTQNAIDFVDGEMEVDGAEHA